MNHDETTKVEDAVVIPETETTTTTTTNSNLPAEKTATKQLVHLDKSGRFDKTKYTPAEIEKAKSLSANLSESDPNSILAFGTELQNKLSGYSDQFLNKVKAFDAGEIGESITDLLGEINYIDVDPTDQSTFKRMLMKIPGFKKLAMTSKKLFQKYDSVAGNIDGIVTKLDAGRMTILRDNIHLGQLFDQNLIYIDEIEELITAAYFKRDELEAELFEMESNPQNYEPYQIQDKRDFISRIGKKITDMEQTRMITIMTLPQIRLVQNNNTTMAEKVQSTIQNTIPIWRNNMSLAVSIMRSKKMADIQDKIYDTTNELLAKNSAMLKDSSIQIAKQNERSIVSMETLKKNKEDLVTTLNELKRIKEEGDVNRKNISKELTVLEEELEKSITQGTSIKRLK